MKKNFNSKFLKRRRLNQKIEIRQTLFLLFLSLLVLLLVSPSGDQSSKVGLYPLSCFVEGAHLQVSFLLFLAHPLLFFLLSALLLHLPSAKVSGQIKRQLPIEVIDHDKFFLDLCVVLLDLVQGISLISHFDVVHLDVALEARLCPLEVLSQFLLLFLVLLSQLRERVI